jgi:hypothetical protein
MSPVRNLCPGLVVPPNNDCFLAVPAVQNTLSRQGSEFDVRDLSGKPVIRVEIGLAWGIAPANRRDNLLLTLHAAGMPGGAPILGTCRAMREEGGDWTVYIYDHHNELFASVSRDPFRSCYTLSSSIMNAQYVFDGNPRDRVIRVTNERGNTPASLASTRPSGMDFDPRGEYYQMHVKSNVDVGLILCGMLAMEHLELF